jgi:2-dehydro-3-deoxy-D-arabinonate dehydratase
LKSKASKDQHHTADRSLNYRKFYMKLYRKGDHIHIDDKGKWYLLHNMQWDELVNRKNLHGYLANLLSSLKPLPVVSIDVNQPLDPPLGNQEIWAAGVTYFRSKEARMEESKDAGGGSFYDKVYTAERPELFFKALPYRTGGHMQDICIRKDSGWNVPEPELTLFISSEGSIEGYTVGNDMSSRSIEGENPLYLPQAKSYDKSATLGPCLYVPGQAIPPETFISIEIIRKGEIKFSGNVQISQMKRKHEELVEFLFRECKFPYGCFLMTGTGIVPPDHFTLEIGDVVSITIDSIGTLINQVNVNS